MHQYDVGHLDWAFGVVCTALGLAAFFACLMFAFNRPGPRQQRMRRPATARLRGPGGFPVSVQFPADLGDERFHIPYFGDVTPDQLVRYGAAPMPQQPPSYETATRGVSYSPGRNPPPPLVVGAASSPEAPPSYEDVAKEVLVLPQRREVQVARLPNGNNKDDQERS